MMDYNFIDENGFRVPVSKMDIKDIVGILADGGLQICNSDGVTATPEDVLERLRIEVLIRELNL